MILSNLRSLNNRIFHRIRLTTKLMVMMLTLLALSLTASVFLSHMAQQALIADIEESIHDLSNATAVSLEQLSGEPDAGQLQKLLSRLGRKGVKEIKLLDVEKEVVASSPPQQTGRKMETTVVKGGQREYNVTAPLVDGTDVLGYIHVTFTLEDLAKANRATLIKRVAVTLLIFALGIAASLYLARKYTQPLHGVVEAAKRVTAGDLTKTIEVEGADEIAELTKSFNEMVEKLRQHRELEERLREAERLSAVGKLASGIAHEIRNPLNFISLSIDHIRSRLNASRGAGLEETQVLIANIKDEIHRLNDMVENFLTVGKPLALNKTDVDVNVLIRDVVGLAQQKAVEQGIEIHVEGPAAIPRLHVDPAQVKTCLMNVVLNAIQAMPAGGTLAVRVAYRPDGLGNLGREDEKPPGGVEVWVSDTGSGILEEELGKIFNPYFTTKKLGIGLGLAITKKIVEEHGGQISVMSRAHEGTTVVITFPLDQVTEVAV
ncbi:MAG: HAMP domain-containing protein [Nitrospirae bacterium]|nr:MAG: HAMP domain-containing protein [Nitrospirota bacterium]